MMSSLNPITNAQSISAIPSTIPAPITIAPVSTIKPHLTMPEVTLASNPRGPIDLLQKNPLFGCTTVDSVTVPYIMRGSMKYVSVKMVEKKLLSKFPKINMEDMNNVCPIYSYYISESEAKLLSEISKTYNPGGGVKSFSTTDLIVSLEDFEKFYDRAKQHFSSLHPSSAVAAPINVPGPPVHRMRGPTPKSMNIPLVPQGKPGLMPKRNIPQQAANIPTMRVTSGNKLNIPPGPILKPVGPGVMNIPRAPVMTAKSVSSADARPMAFEQGVVSGGWVQINNTVVPYILRNGVKHVPLSVIKYGAGLLTEENLNRFRLPVSQEEFEFLNTSCKSAGVNFTFSIKTKLITLEQVIRMSKTKVIMNELPLKDPFTHAEWSEDHCKQTPGSIPNIIKPMSIISATGIHPMPPRNPFIYQAASQSLPRHSQANGKLIQAKVTVSNVPVDVKMLPSGPRGVSDGSRPSSAQSTVSVTPPPGAKSVIKSYQFEGKTVSCLLRKGENTPYALLEALVRLYFTQCSLQDFQAALQQVLQVPVYELSDEEEAEFIRFYGLRVKTLRCKVVVAFEDFKRCHIPLMGIFANKFASNSIFPNSVAALTSAPASKENQKQPESKQQQQQQQKPADATEVENNNNKDAVSVKNKEETAKTNGEVNLKTNGESLLKRPSQTTTHHPRKSKQPKRLEDAVAKLKMRKETPEPNNDSDN